MSLWRRIKWFWLEMQEHPDKPETWLGFCGWCMRAQPSEGPSLCVDCVRRSTEEAE